jgi:hypothetical protein
MKKENATHTGRKRERDYEKIICFDELSWRLSNEMAKENGIGISALIRVLVRQQYQQRHKQQLVA